MTVVVVMGVAGSGKTTVGAELARRLGVPFADADEFHPPANIAKMSSGIPLTDDDRWPWLHAIARWIGDHADHGGVVTCSALRRSYRDLIATGGRVFFVHLHGDRDLIALRVGMRTDHFMPESLVNSQFADLEPLASDEPGAVVDAADTPENIATRSLHALTTWEHAT